MEFSPPRVRSSAFTLLELLAVIAVIGILASLVFPSIGSARKSANRAKTKVQFNQWAAAIESFRSEYGYYPTFDSTNFVNGGAPTTAASDHVFHDILAGKRRDGSPLMANSSALTQNKKRISFYTFTDGEFTEVADSTPYLLRDAFGSTSIAVLVDRNLDGKIDATDYPSFPLVTLPDGSLAAPTSGSKTADIPTAGIRAGVAFYSADPLATRAAPLFVLSWK